MVGSGARHAGPLTDLKVLDLAGPIGVYCAKLLADLGADVVRIEPPAGDPMRDIGPFYGDEPHPEKGLYWPAWGRRFPVPRESPRRILRLLDR